MGKEGEKKKGRLGGISMKGLKQNDETRTRFVGANELDLMNRWKKKVGNGYF